jgi:hypothetical protein
MAAEALSDDEVTTSGALANRLRQYDVKPAVLWFGSKQARGYRRADLSQPWRRYLHSTPAASVTSVTSLATSDDMAEGTVADVTDVTHSSGHWEDNICRRHKCWHCDQRGETVEVNHRGVTSHLHWDCIDPWIAQYEDRVGPMEQFRE